MIKSLDTDKSGEKSAVIVPETDPVTIINNLLMEEEEDDKVAVKKQIGEFPTNWGREPPALSECEEVFPLESVKIEPDSDSEEDVSSTQDSLPPSYPLDVKPILVNYSLKEETAIPKLVVKIRNIYKYLVTTEQGVENITEGFSVDLETIKHLLNKSILDDDVPVYDDDKYKYGDVRCKADDDNTVDDDDSCNDDYGVDDDGSYEDDDKDGDYKVEEEEDYSGSDEEKSESSDEDYEDNLKDDDDWKPHRRNKKCGLMKRKQHHKGAFLKNDRFKGKFGGLGEGFAKRHGKPSFETKPEMVKPVDNGGDDVVLVGRETCGDKSVDLTDSSRVTSSTFGNSEKSYENSSPPEESIPVQITSSDSSVVTNVAKALTSHPSSGVKETKGDCGDDSGVEVITTKQMEKNSDRPQEKKKKKMVRCSVCDKVYSKSQLKIHTRTHTGERPFKCDICGKAFMKGDHLKTHRQRHSEERPFKCSVCGKGFHTKSGLRAHNAAVHSEIRRFKCQICDVAFKHKGALKTHEKTIHERAGVVMCSVCHRTFSSQEEVDRHKRIHLAHPRQGCVYCGKQFTLIRSLLGHERSCPSKSFHCEICDFSTKLKYTLIVHMRHHTGEKPYLCQYCGKKWPSRSCLSTHEKTHSDQRPHKCQVCEKTYRRSSHLRRHEKLHSGEKSYKCQFCNESFQILESKVFHEKTKHWGIKVDGRSRNKIPYRDMPKLHKCSFCDKKFVLTCERNLHERERHTGFKPFSCSICGRKFSRKRRATSHVLNVHQKMGCVEQVDRETVLETVQPRPKRKCRQNCKEW